MRKKDSIEKRALIKKTIIESTKQIIQENGFEGVSIRKISKMVGYTPGNIYQYYDNKEAILQDVIKDGYLQIIRSIMAPVDNEKPMTDQITNRFIHYAIAAIKMNEYYKTVMLSKNPVILAETAIFNNPNDNTKKAMHMLKSMISVGVTKHEFIHEDPEKLAKVLWSAVFGLIMKLIIEEVHNEDEIRELVSFQLKIYFFGLKRKEGVESNETLII